MEILKSKNKKKRYKLKGEYSGKFSLGVQEFRSLGVQGGRGRGDRK